MLKLKILLKILLYVSIIFLVIYIYQNGLFFLPKIYSPGSLTISLIFLFTGFLADTWGWQLIINDKNQKVKYRNALISTGLFIFSKYIPGKVWIILGKATYMKNFTRKNVFELTGLSLMYQIIALVAGMSVGILGILGLGFDKYVIISVMLFILILSILVFSGLLGKIIYWGLTKFVNKDYRFVMISKTRLFSVLGVSLLIWISWAIGFYFLVITLLPGGNISPIIGLGFPFAAIWGIAAFFAPGGIGVREGILTAYLNLSDLNIEFATSVSVLSRIWFLIGETFIFLIAVVLNWTSKFISKRFKIDHFISF